MHKQFAEIYDIFMKYVDYDGWYNFLKRFVKTKGTVLDLGCGTGEFVLRFLKDGFSVVAPINVTTPRSTAPNKESC